jgi:hypothetical protein
MLLRYNTVIQVRKSLFDEMNATDPDPKVLLFAANNRWLEQFKRMHLLFSANNEWLEQFKTMHGFQDS